MCLHEEVVDVRRGLADGNRVNIIDVRMSRITQYITIFRYDPDANFVGRTFNA